MSFQFQVGGWLSTGKRKPRGKCGGGRNVTSFPHDTQRPTEALRRRRLGYKGGKGREGVALVVSPSSPTTTTTTTTTMLIPKYATYAAAAAAASAAAASASSSSLRKATTTVSASPLVSKQEVKVPTQTLVKLVKLPTQTLVKVPTQTHVNKQGDSTSQLVNKQGDSTSQLVNKQGDSTSQLVNKQRDSTSQLVNKQGDSTSQLVNKQRDSTSQLVNKQGDSTSQLVNKQGDSTSQLVNKQGDSTSQLVNKQEVKDATKTLVGKQEVLVPNKTIVNKQEVKIPTKTVVNKQGDPTKTLVNKQEVKVTKTIVSKQEVKVATKTVVSKQDASTSPLINKQMNSTSKIVNKQGVKVPNKTLVKKQGDATKTHVNKQGNSTSKLVNKEGVKVPNKTIVNKQIPTQTLVTKQGVKVPNKTVVNKQGDSTKTLVNKRKDTTVSQQNTGVSASPFVTQQGDDRVVESSSLDHNDMEKNRQYSWVRNGPYYGFYGLNQEIIDLYKWLSPTPRERKARREVTEKIREVVKCLWPQARVEMVGSSGTGLYLPSSDLDITILGDLGDAPYTHLRAGLDQIELPQQPSPQPPQLLSRLLLNLLHFFGHRFDFDNLGISVRESEHVVSKSEIQRTAPSGHDPSLLCILDPFDPNNDVGVSSFRFSLVLKTFRRCENRLVYTIKNWSPQYTMLGNIFDRLSDMYPNRHTRY
ncbi:hypothetical protein Pmani_008048 [Petrolisthes manimaculis]|uniref:Polymerase nucleotidyl transferase domain-containing protein n=1 Tax=Petrolisthes manimaculis TaxID=1843537 RepID=A0AAE1Q7N6_9EUCA|nr:hypothetical protein Pmani_008048 [Petrolisthes manimaculis]